MLTEYFESREISFVAGTYRIVFPDPIMFEPPVGVFLLASDDSGAIGCGGVRRIAPGRFEIKHLYLRDATRGRGYGRALLTELERRALGFGVEEFVLDTNETLVAAGQLYRTSGYETIAPYNDNPNATHWYRKRAAPPPRSVEQR